MFIAEVVREGSWTQGWRHCILKYHNNKSLDRTKSAASKGTDATKKTDLGHCARSDGRAISLLDAFEPRKEATTGTDAALLAVEPHEALPADSTLPPLPTESEIRR